MNPTTFLNWAMENRTGLSIGIPSVPFVGYQMTRFARRKRRRIAISHGKIVGRVGPFAPKHGRPVTISERQHELVIGRTGFGKTTTLINQGLSDAKAGRGVVIVDCTKGDWARDFADRLPESVFSKVCYADLESDYAVDFNPYHVPDEVRKLGPDEVEAFTERASEGFADFLKSTYSTSWGDKLEATLHNINLTLMAAGATPLEAMLLLGNEKYRRHCIDRLPSLFTSEITLDLIADFWETFANYTDAQRENIIGPLSYKFGRLARSGFMRPLIGQTGGKGDPFELVNTHGGILILRAPKSCGRATAALLGNLVLHRTWAVMSARPRRWPNEKMRPLTSVYVDEAKDWATPSGAARLAEMYAEARGLGGWLGISYQSRSQIPDGLKGAIAANACNVMCFCVSDTDEGDMSKVMGTSVSVLRNRRFEALVLPLGVQAAYHVMTLPMPESAGSLAAVVSATNDRWARSRAEVNDEIIRRQREWNGKTERSGNVERGGFLGDRRKIEGTWRDRIEEL